MSEKTPTTNNSEEIDLGQLFQLIGNAFQKFFNFIGSIFKGIFDFILLCLLFVQKHFLKFVIAGVIGIALGFYLDLNRDDEYISSMVVEPNFNSVQQLYNNVEFYNELAESEDSIVLASVLGIDTIQAASIKEVFIESFTDQNQKLQYFDSYIKGLDSVSRSLIDYENFLKNFNNIDARFHKISIIATDPLVAPTTQASIIASVESNDYFKLQKSISDVNIELQDSIYQLQLREIDSLQSLYKEVTLKEADKDFQGTNISLAETTDRDDKELALLNKIESIKDGLVALNSERANKDAIINVISNFPRKGVELKGFLYRYKFVLPVVFVGLLLALLLLLELNKFLKNIKLK